MSSLTKRLLKAAPLPRTRVMVALAAQDMCHTAFAYDLARMMAVTVATAPEIELRLQVHKDTLLPRSRTGLALSAIADGCTHVLFLDTDMRFPRDTLLRLLAHQLPLVAASYATRRHPITPVALCDVPGSAPGVAAVPVYSDTSSGTQPVDYVGLGCMLVETAVLKATPLPWFAIPYDGERGEFGGEDSFFCRRVREAGTDIVIDHDLSCDVRHIGEFEYGHEHAAALRDMPLAEPKLELV